MVTMLAPDLIVDNTLDRRSKPRLDCDYPAQVRVYTPNGKKINKAAILSNLSAGGLYLRLDQRLESGAGLFILVRVVEEPADKYRAFSIASQGTVVRSEPQADGQFGVAVRFNHRRLM